MLEVNTIGLDLAKHVFQVHGADISGRVVIRERLRRAQVLEVFGRQPRCMMACGVLTSGGVRSDGSGMRSD